MRFDELNAVIDSIFTKDEIDSIYNAVGSPTHELFMHRYGQEVKDFDLSTQIKDKIVNICKSVSGYEDLELVAFQFARYEKNEKTKPNLVPHYDNFDIARFTFDIQLKSNIDWALFVEDKEFVLKDNQALTFSGTHQIHWREPKVFNDGDFVDMLFCHLNVPGDNKPLNDILPIMDEKEKVFFDKYNERYGL